MRNEYFQVNRPVGTGHSRAGDVVRIRKALRETGHGSSPPEPSDAYDASAIAAIERFQRDFGLKKDGVILPEGPTERVLDAALAARRHGGAEAQEKLRDVFQTLSEEGLQFRRTGAGPAESNDLVDEDGQPASAERLIDIFERSPQRKGIQTAMILKEIERRRNAARDEHGSQRDDDEASDGNAPVQWGDILLKMMPRLLFPEIPPADDSGNKPARSGAEQAPQAGGSGKGEPTKTTVPVKIDTRIPPFAPEVPDLDQKDVPPPPPLKFPPGLPGREIEEARPGS